MPDASVGGSQNESIPSALLRQHEVGKLMRESLLPTLWPPSPSATICWSWDQGLARRPWRWPALLLGSRPSRSTGN